MKRDWSVVAQNIHNVMCDYMRNAGVKALVLGESGGIDSALTSVFARAVCDELGIRFIGRSLTIETNTQEERRRASVVGNAFCHDFKEVDLTPLYHATREAMEEMPVTEDTESKNYRLRMGNMKARMRMIYLYNLAQRHKGLVLSTDNQSEWMLGFWTLHGDVGDFDPLFGLWKTEVYNLAKYMLVTLPTTEQQQALASCIACVPTDGLGITSSDVEQLGAKDYTEVDNALIEYIQHGTNNVNPTVVNRHIASEFKRVNPVFITREEVLMNS